MTESNADPFAENRTLREQIAQLKVAVVEFAGQQKATAEILRAISSSKTDIQPVFAAIARNAVLMCNARFCAAFRFDGEFVHFVAQNNLPPAAVHEMQARFPMRPIPESPAGQAILTKAVVHLRDALLESEYARTFAVSIGWREVFAVPMLREGVPVGAIVVGWAEIGTMQRKHKELLKTFADQAVIAIENVRLFNETKDALEQQTATADILRIISGSLTDTQPVFDAIVRNCGNLFMGARVVLWLIGDDHLHARATNGETVGATPIDRTSAIGACVLDGKMVHLPSLDEAAEQYPRTRQLGLNLGYHSAILAPLLREDQAIGGISVVRRAAGAFNDKEVTLLNTFADQAVIAIENVRLFKEIGTRNRELIEALEQQTATSEILRVISSSPTDYRPVMSIVAERAASLCDANDALIYRVDGDKLRFLANFGSIAKKGDVVPLTRGMVTGRAVIERRSIHVPDISAELDHYPDATPYVESAGLRTVLSCPLMLENTALGVITIRRTEVRPFTNEQIALLQTFANQAAIALENVRLFNEIQDKNRQLQVASQHKSEFLANMSHELRTPLNAVIGFSEVLGERMFGELTDKQAEYVKDIHASGAHLLSLINDILDLSKVEAGRMELDVATFSVPMAIDNALTLIKERAGRHGITLECSIHPAVGDINADERKMKQILLNLLSNAVKFTPDGGRISIAANSIAGGVEISVTDTGIGIAPEDCAAVFEEFKQVGQQSDAKAEGTGLGLALARKFVALHGGKIDVTSGVGKGSKFTFSLLNCPLRQSAGA